VVQEVARASYAVVICGSRLVPWDCFNQWPLRRASIERTTSSRLPAVLKYRSGSSSSDGTQALLRMLHETRSSDATDPRDKVFALLGMLPDQERSTYLGLIDYSASIEYIYQNTACDILLDTGSLRFLSAVQPHTWTSHSSLSKPKSWVPDWSQTSDVTPLALGHNFVQPYNAGGRYVDLSDYTHAGLSLRGVRVAEVHLVSKTAKSDESNLGSIREGHLHSWCDTVQAEVRKYREPLTQPS
jgi:hypothetical protein